MEPQRKIRQKDVKRERARCHRERLENESAALGQLRSLHTVDMLNLKYDGVDNVFRCGGRPLEAVSGRLSYDHKGREVLIWKPWPEGCSCSSLMQEEFRSQVSTSTGGNDYLEYTKAVFVPNKVPVDVKSVPCEDPVVDSQTALFEIQHVDPDDNGLSKLRLDKLREKILKRRSYFPAMEMELCFERGFDGMDRELEDLVYKLKKAGKTVGPRWYTSGNCTMMFVDGKKIHFVGSGPCVCTVVHRKKPIFQYSLSARTSTAEQANKVFKAEIVAPIALPRTTLGSYKDFSEVFTPDQDTYILMSNLFTVQLLTPWLAVLHEGLEQNLSLEAICVNIMSVAGMISPSFELACFLVKFKG